MNPSGQPEFARDVGAIEIERLEALRTNTFDVPPVKELVRDGAEQPTAVARDRAALTDHGAVAMLHAIATRPRQVIGEERVVPWFEEKKDAKTTTEQQQN